MNKLTYKEKQLNKTKYRQIRKGWESTDKHLDYKQFKNRVLAESQAYDITVKEAVKKVINSEAFTTAAQRSRHNLKEALKRDYKEIYAKMRNYSRDEKGHYKSIELEWDKERGAYTFTGFQNGILTRFIIDVIESPHAVTVYAI